MKYSIIPYEGCNIINQVYELNLTRIYPAEDVIKYVENHPNQRLVIRGYHWKDFLSSTDYTDHYYPYFKQNPQCSTICFCIPIDVFEEFSSEDKQYWKDNVPCYMFDYGCKTWDELYEQLFYGAAEVIVYGELGFSIDKVSEIVHAAGAQLAVIPDMVQNGARDVPYSNIRKFFIRPEDTDLYEDYLDIFKLAATGNTLDIHYTAYAGTKDWFGPLKEIIYGLKSDIDNRCIIETFGSARLSCGQKCVKYGKCDICGRCEELSDLMREYELIFYKK